MDNPTLAIVGRELIASTNSVEKMQILLKNVDSTKKMQILRKKCRFFEKNADSTKKMQILRKNADSAYFSYYY